MAAADEKQMRHGTSISPGAGRFRPGPGFRPEAGVRDEALEAASSEEPDVAPGEWPALVVVEEPGERAQTHSGIPLLGASRSLAQVAIEAEARKLYREPGSMIKGRPTKRDRRALSKASE